MTNTNSIGIVFTPEELAEFALEDQAYEKYHSEVVQYEQPDADSTLNYIREWELECGIKVKTPEQIAEDEADKKEWDDYFMNQERELNSAKNQITDNQSLTVKDTVKGRLPEYVKGLFILSNTVYQTDDKTVSYRIAICGKPTNSPSADNVYLVLDINNQYRGSAKNELLAEELAEYIIRKPTPSWQIL